MQNEQQAKTIDIQTAQNISDVSDVVSFRVLFVFVSLLLSLCCVVLLVGLFVLNAL